MSLHTLFSSAGKQFRAARGLFHGPALPRLPLLSRHDAATHGRQCSFLSAATPTKHAGRVCKCVICVCLWQTCWSHSYMQHSDVCACHMAESRTPVTYTPNLMGLNTMSSMATGSMQTAPGPMSSGQQFAMHVCVEQTSTPVQTYEQCTSTCQTMWQPIFNDVRLLTRQIQVVSVVGDYAHDL